MWRQYLFFFFQSADWKSAPACVLINSYPHWALGSAGSPYHDRTQNFPWSVVLHHPLFPPTPSSVISFPQTFLSDSHSSSLLLHKFFMYYISFSVGLSMKLPNQQFDFPIFLFSACSLVCYLAKGNLFAVRRKGHHHWCWTPKYHDIN